MNLFELSIIATPAAGAAGAVTAGSRCSGWVAAAIGIGVGIALYLACLGFSSLVLRRTRWREDVVIEGKASSPLQDVAELVSVFLFIVSPFGAWFASSGIVKLIGN